MAIFTSFPNQAAKRSSRYARGGGAGGVAEQLAGADSFPDFRTLNGKVGTSLDAEHYNPISEIDRGHFEQGLESVGPTDYDRFMASSRQDQHDTLQGAFVWDWVWVLPSVFLIGLCVVVVSSWVWPLKTPGLSVSVWEVSQPLV
ncbi:MAG TPA: hypothetical protein VHX86_02050 [Tepidisphaeraceae bacterium]|jgi:hypothetical protein|nr:hypothetical protein [Tepidisphaeraceae bacterium]